MWSAFSIMSIRNTACSFCPFAKTQQWQDQRGTAEFGLQITLKETSLGGVIFFFGRIGGDVLVKRRRSSELVQSQDLLGCIGVAVLKNTINHIATD